LIILDSRYHPPLPELKKPGKQLIGYLSLGEASPDYSYFEQLRSAGLLVSENPVWKGNYSIDIRDRRWWSLLIETVPVRQRN
jgi:endo-alpha-1,4-polygalactosaminidase (GH114 family)